MTHMARSAVRAASCRALAALGLCAAVAGTGPAMAAVRYELQSQVLTTSVPSVAEAFAGGRAPLPLTFTVSDDAVSRGNFNIRGFGNFNGQVETIIGDVADFVSIHYMRGPVYTPLFIRGLLDMRVTFMPDRSVESFYLNFGNYSDDFTLRSIAGNLVGTTQFGLDSISPCGQDSCFVAGRIEVPEPASMALLGFGLLGLAAVRRRNRFMSEPCASA